MTNQLLAELEMANREITRLNNIISHIYKELRNFDVCGDMGVSIQISYLEEYLEKEIETLEEEYLKELKENKQ